MKPKGDWQIKAEAWLLGAVITISLGVGAVDFGRWLWSVMP